MPSYLVETFLARSEAGERPERERRARAAAEELSRGGARVAYDHAIHVPDDEICFFVFEAPSSLDAARAAKLAGLEAVRVVRSES
jgi:hypothetical protein